MGPAFDVDNNNNSARSLIATMILLSYAFLVLAARGVVKDFFGNGSRVEFFIREGGCLDLSTRAVGLYSIFTAPYFLLTVFPHPNFHFSLLFSHASRRPLSFLFVCHLFVISPSSSLVSIIGRPHRNLIFSLFASSTLK